MHSKILLCVLCLLNYSPPCLEVDLILRFSMSMDSYKCVLQNGVGNHKIYSTCTSILSQRLSPQATLLSVRHSMKICVSLLWIVLSNTYPSLLSSCLMPNLKLQNSKILDLI